jgi:hypothetical protein
MLRFWMFIVCLLWLAWSAAQMNVLWTVATYVLTGVFCVAHERQKPSLEQIAMSHLYPLRAVVLWPVLAYFAAVERIRSLKSAERYVVSWGDWSAGQEARFRTWGEALSFACQKAKERVSAARESASLPDHAVIILDYGRLRASKSQLVRGLTHAQYMVEESGAIRRIM